MPHLVICNRKGKPVHSLDIEMPVIDGATLVFPPVVVRSFPVSCDIASYVIKDRPGGDEVFNGEFTNMGSIYKGATLDITSIRVECDRVMLAESLLRMFITDDALADDPFYGV